MAPAICTGTTVAGSGEIPAGHTYKIREVEMLAGEENLIPMSERSKDEARELGRKGGIRSGEVRKQNADIKKRLKEIANMALRAGDIDEITTMADAKSANLSISDALLVKMIAMALGGNIKAMNSLLGMLSNDPGEAQEASQSVSNSFVQALTSTASEVWANEAPEEE